MSQRLLVEAPHCLVSCKRFFKCELFLVLFYPVMTMYKECLAPLFAIRRWQIQTKAVFEHFFMKPHMPFNIIFKILSFMPNCIETGQYENFEVKFTRLFCHYTNNVYMLSSCYRKWNLSLKIGRSLENWKWWKIDNKPGGFLNAIKTPRYQHYLDRLID